MSNFTGAVISNFTGAVMSKDSESVDPEMLFSPEIKLNNFLKAWFSYLPSS